MQSIMQTRRDDARTQTFRCSSKDFDYLDRMVILIEISGPMFKSNFELLAIVDQYLSYKDNLYKAGSQIKSWTSAKI
jgi:hypothetical protein